ncbi:MAG: DNA-binding beta-propeller fold protein YncE [Myxococcota bacterium]|jgi:DNA-binding beta-propeller fold protein YncE
MKRIATSLLSPSLSLAVAGLVSLSLAGCPELPFMGDTVDIQPPHPNPGPALVTETDPDAPFPNESPAAPQPLAAEAAPAWSSGRALALNDGLLYAVDSANEDLVVLDVTTEMVVRRINLDSFGPQQVAVGPDGTAFVTLRYGYSVARIAPGSATATTQLVGAEPIGIALSPDAAHVFVTVAGEDALVVLDAVTLQQEARVNTIVRPRTVALDAAGNSLVVAGQDRVAERFSVQYVGGLVQLNSEFPMMLRTTSPADAMLHFARPQAVQANRARGSVALPGSNSMLVVHEQAMTGTEADSLAGAFAEVFPEEGPESSGGYGGGGGSKFSDAPHILRPLECSVTTVGDAFGEADGWPVRDGQTGRPMTGLIAQPSDINHHPTWSIALVTGHGSDNVLVLNTGDTDPMRSPLGIIEVGQAPRAVVFDPTGERANVLSSQSF